MLAGASAEVSGARVIEAPSDGSKRCSFWTFSHSLLRSPALTRAVGVDARDRVAAGAAGHVGGPGVLLELAQLLGLDLVAALEVEVGVDLRAHRLGELDRRRRTSSRHGPRGRTAASSKSSGRMPTMTALRARSVTLQAPAQLVVERDRAHRRLDRLAVHVAGEEVHGRRADEPRHEQVARVLVELLRRGDLLQDAGAHDGHAVAERHGLGLVVGHVDRGRVEALLQARDRGAHLDAQLGVEVGERLVHEEGLRLAHDRAAHGHALALAAGEVGRLAVEMRLEVEGLRGLGHAPVDLLGLLLAQLQREAHVVAHAHVRVQGVVLEDHRDVAILGGQVVDDLPADLQVALRDVLEPGDHAQRGRLPAPRGPDEDEQLPVGDLKVQVLDGFEAVRIALDDVVELDLGHVQSPLPCLLLAAGLPA